MKKEKLIALLQALPDDTEVILFTEEGDLRNDFELSDSSEYYDQELIPRNGLHYYVLEYSWHQYGFPEHVNYKKAK